MLMRFCGRLRFKSCIFSITRVSKVGFSSNDKYFSDIGEYLLESKDVKNCPRYFSRSPYSHDNPLIVYRKKDLEEIAYKKYGGKETFEKILKFSRVVENRRNTIFGKEEEDFLDGFEGKYIKEVSKSNIFSTGTGQVVLYAIIINGFNFLGKLVAAYFTDSKSMFCEALHSLADTINQIIIAYGLVSSERTPDEDHPYGYKSMENITSLISGVGIFFVGFGLSSYHSVFAFMSAKPVVTFDWLIPILGLSLLSEGVTFIMALKHASKEAEKENFSLFRYVYESVDPSLNVVLLEDSAALLGVIIAGVATLSGSYFNSYLPDALGSAFISAIIGSVALFIMRTNIDSLLRKSIPDHTKKKLQKILDEETIVSGSHDMKATFLGDEMLMKVELDIDGKVLTQKYIETISLDEVFKESKKIHTEEEMKDFILKYGEDIVSIVGAEVNRIEKNIKKRSPHVKHIDIEIN